jgi:hypothetical protein
MADSDYQPVRDALPPTLPPITREEARRAVARLYRKFGKLDSGRVLKPHPVRRCWISTEPTSGHWKGWGRLIHDVSHHIFGRVYPNKRPHDKLHSHYESEIARYVASTDWLQGGLKPKQKRKPTLDERRAEKARRYEDALKRWRAKAKRADTAIRKYERSLKRLAA